MQEDIDWMNASVDCGLIALCRELQALAAPFEAAAAMTRGRSGRRLRAQVKRRMPMPAPPAVAAQLIV